MKTIVLFLFFVGVSVTLNAYTPPDSCRCFPLTQKYHIESTINPRDTIIYVNQDSALVLDTCGLFQLSSRSYSDCGDIYENWDINKEERHSRLYAKQHWTVRFDVAAIYIPKAPSDTIIEVSWEAIDTSFAEIRTAFQQLEQQYGAFRLRKFYPDYDTNEFSQVFLLYFDNYVNIFDIEEYIDSIPNTSCDFSRWIVKPVSVNNENGESLIKDKIFSIIASNNKKEILIQTNIDFSGDNFIIINDMNGRAIKTIKIENSFSGTIIPINVSDLIKGIYFVCIGNYCNKFYVNH
jgi:hypothetical protein